MILKSIFTKDFYPYIAGKKLIAKNADFFLSSYELKFKRCINTVLVKTLFSQMHILFQCYKYYNLQGALSLRRTEEGERNISFFFGLSNREINATVIVFEIWLH